MREDRPLILLTNDDGVHSPGLAALCEAVAPLGEVLIAAPATQQTSTGRSYPRGPEWGKIQAISLPMPWGEIPAFSVTASPAACVGHGVLELAPRKPDLCISGINYGENLGKTLTYSGTFGAALQAADFGIPTLAVSRATSYEQIRGDYVCPSGLEQCGPGGRLLGSEGPSGGTGPGSAHFKHQCAGRNGGPPVLPGDKAQQPRPLFLWKARPSGFFSAHVSSRRKAHGFFPNRAGERYVCGLCGWSDLGHSVNRKF